MSRSGFTLTATHSDKMGDAAVDTSTLCLFDVDGTLTAARQVASFVCLLSLLCVSEMQQWTVGYTSVYAPFIRMADDYVTSAQTNIRVPRCHLTYLPAASGSQVSTTSKYMCKTGYECSFMFVYLFDLSCPSTMK